MGLHQHLNYFNISLDNYVILREDVPIFPSGGIPVTYRPARQDQILLLPPSLENLIGEKDLCRVVNAFVEALPRSSVEERFRPASGALAFHPRMMLKILLYACAPCGECPVHDLCVTQGSGNRYLRHSPVLNRYQSETRERLKSERGVELRRRRSPEIETVFGHIKHNLGIRRFLLRGLRKVTTEWTWIALGYNLTRLLGRLNASPTPWNADQLFAPRALKIPNPSRFCRPSGA
jgi:hypothetical protein